MQSNNSDENSSENGFELVDRPNKDTSSMTEPTPLPSWINPPTNLPINLMSGPAPLLLPAGQLFPTTSTPTAGTPQFFTNLAGSHGSHTQQGHSLPVLLPLSPDGDHDPHALSGASALEIAVLESPTTTTNPVIPDKAEMLSGADGSPKGGGLFGWIPGKGILAKVAEKARSSVDTMITTLDPQMKEFIYSGGDVDIAVTSTKEVKVSAVREAFQTVFGKATVKGFESQSTNVAAQPVGFASGLQAARERIANLRSSGTVPQQQTIVAVEGFVVELNNSWFEMSCLLLEDPVRNVTLQAYTQPLMVPPRAVARMQTCTTDSYPFLKSGFAITVGQAVADELNASPTEWQLELTGISRRDVLVLAAKTLASGFKV